MSCHNHPGKNLPVVLLLDSHESEENPHSPMSERITSVDHVVQLVLVHVASSMHELVSCRTLETNPYLRD